MYGEKVCQEGAGEPNCLMHKTRSAVSSEEEFRMARPGSRRTSVVNSFVEVDVLELDFKSSQRKCQCFPSHVV